MSFQDTRPESISGEESLRARRGKDGFVFLGMKGIIMGQFMWFLFVAAVFYGAIFGFLLEPAST